MDEPQIIAELRAQVAAIRGSAARQQGFKGNSQTPTAGQQSGDSAIDQGALRDALAAVRVSEAAFAHPNPRNPGLLNAVAQTIKKTIGRSLSWYTRSLQLFHSSVARALEIQGQALLSAADQLSSSQARVLQLTEQQRSSGEKIIAIHTDVGWLQRDVAQLKASLHSTIDQRFQSLTQQLQHARDVAETAVRDRLSPYVGYFRDVSPVVDLGCGRGEFVELLKEAGIDSYGVDSDPIVCEEARAKALKIVEADLFTYLRELPERCLGGVFSARVAEYLSTNSLAEMISLCSHKMKPGGVMIIETATPTSDSPFGRTYHTDASHYSPVYPEVLKAMVDSNGFVGSAISVLVPQTVSVNAAGDGTSLDNSCPGTTQSFASARVYAVIARRA